MKHYLKSQNKINTLIINNILNNDEMERVSTSDIRWANNKSKQLSQSKIKKGEIYQFDFGKNYSPEMSYEHRGLVIGVKKYLLYVLPIYSYDPQKHLNVFHPKDYPNNISDLYLLKQSEFSFLAHNSVLKLNDLRTVSINRILYKHTGKINIASDTYKEVEKMAFQRYFPEYAFRFDKMIEEIEKLKNDNKELIVENENLKNTISSLTKSEDEKPLVSVTNE